MKKFLGIILKIIYSLLIILAVVLALNLLVCFLDSTVFGWIWLSVGLMIIGIITMIVSGICACKKSCKCKKGKKGNENKIEDAKKEKSNVVEMPKQEKEDITLLEVIYYIIAIMFVVWFINTFKEIGEVFAKIELIKLHFIWLLVFDAFLFIAARTPRINLKAFVWVYTIINVIFVGTVIGNTPYTNMPKPDFPMEKAYLENLPKMFIADIVSFFAIYPIIKFFRKTKEEAEKESVVK